MAALRRAGFRVDHYTGSHAIMYKEGHPHPISVPDHRGDIKPGTLRQIIKDAGLAIEDFIELL